MSKYLQLDIDPYILNKKRYSELLVRVMSYVVDVGSGKQNYLNQFSVEELAPAEKLDGLPQTISLQDLHTAGSTSSYYQLLSTHQKQKP